MKISIQNVGRTCQESEVYNEVLELDNKKILELGCGAALITQDIASTGCGRKIVAAEVDEAQHNKNRLLGDLPNVEFVLAGAQKIPVKDSSIDVVFMFKSLHHVPYELLDVALQEIHRVLKPGAYAYLSEPVYAGDFNELIRLFHDEKQVRQNAFSAIKKAVEDGTFTLERQLFFNTPVHFKNFSMFESQLINATHSEHHLSDELYQQVRMCFMKNMTVEGARFTAPIRVDLLRK